MEKQCSVCHKNKPLSEFYKRVAGGVVELCKTCSCLRSKEKYNKDAVERAEQKKKLHRVSETRVIECMPFFKQDQIDISPEDFIHRRTWLKIIDERIKMLPVLDGGSNGHIGYTHLNSKAWSGEATTEAN